MKFHKRVIEQEVKISSSKKEKSIGKINLGNCFNVIALDKK